MGSIALIRDSDNGVALKEISSIQENYLAYQAGLYLADSANIPGALIKTSSTDAVSIGSYTNTRYDKSLSDHGGTFNILTTTTTLYQHNPSFDESDSDVRRPLEHAIEASQNKIFEMDSDEMDTLSTRLASRIFTSDYPGTVKLATSAPSGDYTLVEEAFRDTRANDDSDVNIYNIYKRTSMSAPSTARPFALKRHNDSDNGAYEGLQAMSDRQIKHSFGHRVKSLVNPGTNSIGSYQLRSSGQGAPTDTGTWIAKGTATDTRFVKTASDYTRNITVIRYTDYLGDFTGDYTGNYEGNFTREFTGAFEANYLGDGNFSGVFVGDFARDVSDFVNLFTGNYSGNDYLGNFTETFTGTYFRDFSRSSTNNFTGTGATFTSDGVFEISNAHEADRYEYLGVAPGTSNTSVFSGPGESIEGVSAYKDFVGAFLGPQASYIAGDTSYVGTATPGTAYSFEPNNEESVTGYYTGGFSGPTSAVISGKKFYWYVRFSDAGLGKNTVHEVYWDDVLLLRHVAAAGTDTTPSSVTPYPYVDAEGTQYYAGTLVRDEDILLAGGLTETIHVYEIYRVETSQTDFISTDYTRDFTGGLYTGINTFTTLAQPGYPAGIGTDYTGILSYTGDGGSYSGSGNTTPQVVIPGSSPSGDEEVVFSGNYTADYTSIIDPTTETNYTNQGLIFTGASGSYSDNPEYIYIGPKISEVPYGNQNAPYWGGGLDSLTELEGGDFYELFGFAWKNAGEDAISYSIGPIQDINWRIANATFAIVAGHGRLTSTPVGEFEPEYAHAPHIRIFYGGQKVYEATLGIDIRYEDIANGLEFTGTDGGTYKLGPNSVVSAYGLATYPITRLEAGYSRFYSKVFEGGGYYTSPAGGFSSDKSFTGVITEFTGPGGGTYVGPAQSKDYQGNTFIQGTDYNIGYFIREFFGTSGYVGPSGATYTGGELALGGAISRYISDFIGTIDAGEVANFSGGEYNATFIGPTGNYTGPTLIGGDYVGATETYVGGAATQTQPIFGNIDVTASTEYTGVSPGATEGVYTRVGALEGTTGTEGSAETFIAGEGGYSGNYLPTSYAGPSGFTTGFSGSAQYSGAFTGNFTSDTAYERDYTIAYEGSDTFAGTFTDTYTRDVSETYTGDTVFTSSENETFVGPADYSGAEYTGDFTETYTADFVRVTTLDYTSVEAESFTGDFVGEYTGDILDSGTVSVIDTYTLYVRVA